MTSPHWSRPPPSSPVTPPGGTGRALPAPQRIGSGAYVKLTPELALEQARAADEAVAQGRAEGELFGVVCPVKDLFFMAGANARMGSAAFDFPPTPTTTSCRPCAAGLVFTGKTNTPEFGLPCYTEPDPEVAPPARCVWDERRTAGGSSGGAAGGSCRRPGAHSSRFGRWRFGAHPRRPTAWSG